MSPLHIVATLLFIIPCFSILLLTFWEQIKQASLARIVFYILLYLIVAFVGSRAYSSWARSSTLQSLISMVSLFIGICFLSRFVSYSFWQTTFIVTAVKSYMENLRLLTYHINFMFTGELPRDSSSSVVWILAAMTVLSFPFIYALCRKLLLPALSYTASLKTWRLLWIIPVCNNLVYTLAISPDPSHYSYAPGTSFFFIPPLWTMLTLSTYAFLLRVIVVVNENSSLQTSLRLSEMQVASQQKQAETLRESIEGTRRLRHDMRHHLLALQGYVQSGNIDGLERYLEKLEERIPVQTPNEYCDNPVINALLSYYREQSEAAGAETTFLVSLPEQLPFPDTDLCIVLGNLLENAVEACRAMESPDRFIRLKLSAAGRSAFVIIAENSYEGEIRKNERGEFLSSKAAGRLGIGISSILNITEKYNGVPKFEYAGHVFRVSLLLNAKRETE